ncbi:M23 family metallopeptidase [Fusobacterium russii]|uniref:M23 family metallopeptidase n=1 Tax=Fusobacterium russii TaxID=854 RepID=UPI0003AA7157|nr:M23 family metallopeptidase [Fusobacterium russii]
MDMEEKKRIGIEELETFKKRRLEEIYVVTDNVKKQKINFKYLKKFFIFLFSFIIIIIIFFLLLKYIEFQQYIEDTKENMELSKKYLEEQKIKKQEEQRIKEKQKKEDLIKEQEIKEIKNNNFQSLSKISNVKKELMLNLIPSGYPMKKAAKITSPFGMRIHPVFKVKKMHQGIDLKLYIGEDILSTAMGKVSFAGIKRGYGYVVIVDHTSNFQTVYAHLSKIYVKVGEIVGKGKIIAAGGNSGVSTGPHLHYEVRYKGKAIDPKNFIDWNKENFSDIFEKEKNVPWSDFLSIMGKE